MIPLLLEMKHLQADHYTTLIFSPNNSGPNDNVFIFFSGYGGASHINFPEEYMYAVELNDTLAYMHSKKKFNKLVLYVEACYSGSMFEDVLPSNMGIYATTSAKANEKSWAIFCKDPKIDVCLADEYSYAWLIDSEQNDIKELTLEEQYEHVKWKMVLSNVMKYGEMPNVVDRKPSCQAHLLSKSRRFMESATEEEYQVAWQRLHRAIQLGHIVEETFRDIVMDVKTHQKPPVKGLSKRDELMCFRAVFDQFRTHCFTIQQA
ncbi:hypothetical protein T265_15375, partial [Opisthorchis viverrini]